MALPFGLIGLGKTKQEAIADWNAVYEGMKSHYIADGHQFEDVSFTFVHDPDTVLGEA